MNRTQVVDIGVTTEASQLLTPLGVACSLQGRWTPNAAERAAAWDLLVELVTRIAVVPLHSGTGISSEALSSLHALFAAGRSALQRHGPEVAAPRRGELSLATIVAHLLNRVLRPVLAEWHPIVKAQEAAGGPEWETNDARLREVLSALQMLVGDYAKELAEACDAGEFVRFLLDEGMHYRR